ncbi:MAG: GMP synthase [Pseudomonadota bacterium]
MSLHLGILRTDAVLDEFQDRFGDYPQMFRDLLLAVDGQLRFTEYDVRVALPADFACDAYLITGSRHSVYDDLPWIPALADYVRTAMAQGRKILGICFGHQLLAHFFGGHVAPAPGGWAVGVHASTLTPRAWMGDDAPTAMALLSSHKDQVQALPPTAQLYASNTFCPLAGFTLGEAAITIQGHPEFAKPYAAALMNFRRELLGEETFSAGMASLAHDTDSLQMARLLLDFARPAVAASK